MCEYGQKFWITKKKLKFGMILCNSVRCDFNKDFCRIEIQKQNTLGIQVADR